MKGENIVREIFDSIKRHIILYIALFLIGNFIYLGNPGKWIRGIFGNPDVYMDIEDPDSVLLDGLIDVDTFPDQWKLQKGSIYQDDEYLDSSGITVDLAEQWLEGKFVKQKVNLNQRIMSFASDEDLTSYIAYWDNFSGSNDDTITIDIADTVRISDDFDVECEIDSVSYDEETYFRTYCALRKSSERSLEIVSLQASERIADEDLFVMMDDLVVLMQ